MFSFRERFRLELWGLLFGGCSDLLDLDAYRVESAAQETTPTRPQNALTCIAAAPEASACQVRQPTSTPSQMGFSAGAALNPRALPGSAAAGSSVQTAGDAGALKPATSDDAGMSGPSDLIDASAPRVDAGIAHPSGSQAIDMGLAVQYRPLDTDLRNGAVAPALRIINRSATAAVPLCALTLRYYFMNEHAEQCPQHCKIDSFWSGLQPSGNRTEALHSYHAASFANANAYIQIAFPCTSAALGRDDSVEVQQQFHTEPYAELDETNDYSFRLFPSSFVDWPRVTLHYEDVLIWGVPPS